MVEEPSPGVGAGSCSGNPVPAPSGPTISSVARKARLKTMRVGQRTEKTRMVCSLQLSRAALDGAMAQGERRWERLVELNREPQEDPANPTPQPTSHRTYNSRVHIPGAVPLDRGHWPQSLGSGPSFEQPTTHWASLFLVCCWCVGWGQGRENDADAWVFCLVGFVFLSLLETQVSLISFGTKRMNLAFSLFLS